MAMWNLYHRLCTLICSSPHLAINVSCLSYRDTENKKTVNKKTQIAVACKNRGRRVAVSEERTEEVDMTGNKKKKLLCGGIEIGGVWNYFSVCYNPWPCSYISSMRLLELNLI